MSRDISDEAADIFFKKVEDKNISDGKKMASYQKVMREKNNILIPIRKLLKQLVDSGVFVTHNGMYDPTSITRSHAPQPFQVWEGESSPHWQPGGSIFIDHPALIEIAVTNHSQRNEQGLISIACSSTHPDEHLIRGPFNTQREACMALAEFLSSSCLRIERKKESD